MIVTKTALPRRTILRGMGATVALPLLDAMVPALTATSRTAAAGTTRVAFWQTANGVYGPDFKPRGEGTSLKSLTFMPIILPLAPIMDQTVIATGLSNVAAESTQVGSGVHARAASCFLSGAAAHRTEGADIQLAKSLDQYAADVLGRETQLTSMELALESSFVGNCDQGYSCAYVNTFAWRTPTMPLPM